MEPLIEQTHVTRRAPESLPVLPRGSTPFRPFLLAAGALVLAFGKVFFDLIGYAARTDLHRVAPGELVHAIGRGHRGLADVHAAGGAGAVEHASRGLVEAP